MSNSTMQIKLSTEASTSSWASITGFLPESNSITIQLTREDPAGTVQRMARKIALMGFSDLVLSGEEWNLALCWAFWQGYRDPKQRKNITFPTLPEHDQIELDRRLHSINWVRDTINLPAEQLSPEQLARTTVDLFNAITPDRFNYEIIKGEKLAELGYHGLYTVGRGSTREPVLLTLDYNPINDEQHPVDICLVGKGITFDTGGYSLKPSSAMDSMKSDMGGAATLAGALSLAASRGLNKRVKLILCCADNMVSGNAFRLGDIIEYRNGKSVEVMNTDAEGRLVLADGLIDASRCKPKLIIDAATLTGAAKMALGNDYHALFSFDDSLATEILAVADQQDEPFWRLPLAPCHRKQLPSNFAELSNIAAGAHTAGASTAAGFLSHFVEQYRLGWLHIDCSATYRKNAVEQWSAGATGLGVLTLAALLAH